MMTFYPSKEEAKRLCELKEYGVIPVSLELYADNMTPIMAIRRIKKASKHCYLLESVEKQKILGRYTFLGYQPILELTCQNHELSISSETVERKQVIHPKETIRSILAQYKSPKLEQLPMFTGGFVGYFSYDYIKYSEPNIHLNAVDDNDFKDVDLMLFDKVIAFDNEKQKIILIANAKAEQIDKTYEEAKNTLYEMRKLLLEGEFDKKVPFLRKSDWKPLFEEETYSDMVEKAKTLIREGDIFQVVLSNRMEAKMEGSLLDAYRVLRTINPSPYMFYFSSEDIEIAGASPETLVKLYENKVMTYPLAGTRKRGSNPLEDKKLEEELLSDEKEMAEHVMLVDLGRNDIGKISKIGTVQVEKYAQVERFSHVMHIGSTVTGFLDSKKDALDAVDAILPAGTLSGAPKLRACEIIDELEQSKRGIYGGAIGYLSFTGELDVGIAIRLAYQKNGTVFVRSGAGIVADSVPKKEYEECLNKAKAVITALDMAEGGIDYDIVNR